MTPARKRLLFGIRIGVWLIVGTCVIVFARRLDWEQVFGSFEGVDLKLALLATAVGLPCTALQGLRWSSLVKAVHSRVPRMTPVAAMYVGQAASAFLPMRAVPFVKWSSDGTRAPLTASVPSNPTNGSGRVKFIGSNCPRACLGARHNRGLAPGR